MPLAEAFRDLEIVNALVWDSRRQTYDAFDAAAPPIINTPGSLAFANATTAQCESAPPASVTTAPATAKSGVHGGAVA